MQAAPARHAAAAVVGCFAAIAADTGDFVIVAFKPCSWPGIMDRSMLIAAKARAGEDATRVAIEVSAAITAVRVSEFEEPAARAAAQGEALATTRPYWGSPTSREWLTRQRQLRQSLISEHMLGPSD